MILLKGQTIPLARYTLALCFLSEIRIRAILDSLSLSAHGTRHAHPDFIVPMNPQTSVTSVPRRCTETRSIHFFTLCNEMVSILLGAHDNDNEPKNPQYIFMWQLYGRVAAAHVSDTG